MKKLIPIVLLVSMVSCKSKKQVNIPLSRTEEPVIVLDTVSIVPHIPDPIIYNESYKRINDLLHTKLEVSFNWEKLQLYGKATLTLAPYFYSTDSLILDAKSFTINRVGLIQKTDTIALNHTYKNDKIRISLGKTYKKGETYQIYISYVANPEEVKGKGGVAIQGAKGLYFINPQGTVKNKPMQIWTQGETESNSCWFPTIDKPNERMTQEIYITVDKKFKILSNGLLIYSKENKDGTHTDYWKQELPAAPYLTMMAIGDYAIVKDKWYNTASKKDIEVNYYVEKEFEQHAKAIFGNTPEMISFYSNVIGVPYPWEKYSQVIVRDYVSGAMENTTAVIHGEFLNKTERELIDEDNESIIAHELFHHWFGDLVTCESWSNLPLNESFATYGEYLWFEYKYGRDQADLEAYYSMEGYFNEASRKKVDLIRFDYSDKEEMFDGHSYNKGGAILHMLRKYVGDDAFFSSLKLYLERHKYKSAEVHDLRLCFEEITGEDLNWFFNQWFLSSGHPELKVEKKYDSIMGKLEVTITQKQDFKKHPVFILPLTIDFYSNGKKNSEKIIIRKPKETFEFKFDSNPELVNFDSEKMLLAEIEYEKTTAELKAQLKYCSLLMERRIAINELSKTLPLNELSEIIKIGLNDKHWSNREIALTKLKDIINEQNKNEWIDILKKIALNDQKSSVRSMAISVFNSINKGDTASLDFYSQTLKDKSYSVVGQAIKGVLAIDKNRALQICSENEKEKSVIMYNSILSIYADAGDDKYNKFFIEASELYKGFNLISFCSYYVTFLKNCNDQTILDALPVFENIAINESSKWTKYFGKKSINELIRFYEEKYDNQKKKIESLKSTNPNATGLDKMEKDLELILIQKQKIEQVYEKIKGL